MDNLELPLIEAKSQAWDLRESIDIYVTVLTQKRKEIEELTRMIQEMRESEEVVIEDDV